MAIGIPILEGWQPATQYAAGASSTIEINVQSAFATLIVFDVTGSTSATTLLRTSTDGGSTFDSGAGNYQHGRVAWATGSGPTQAGSASDTSITAMAGVTRFTGWIMVVRPGEAAACTIFGFLCDAGNRAANHFFGVRVTAADVTHIRFLRSSGTMTGRWNRYRMI